MREEMKLYENLKKRLTVFTFWWPHILKTIRNELKREFWDLSIGSMYIFFLIQQIRNGHEIH